MDPYPYNAISTSALDSYFANSVWPLLQPIVEYGMANQIIQEAISAIKSAVPTNTWGTLEDRLIQDAQNLWMDTWEHQPPLVSVADYGDSEFGELPESASVAVSATATWSPGIKLALAAAIAIPTIVAGWLLWDRYSH